MFQWILNMPLNLLQLFNIAKVNKNMKVLDDSFPQNTFEQLPEVVDQTYSVKKVFLEILQNSQENTCVRVSFLIKCRPDACNFIKKETLAEGFSCEFCEIFTNIFCYRTPPMAASAHMFFDHYLKKLRES